MKRALVTGAGGFIGNHMVKFLKDRGYWVRGVDIKPTVDYPHETARECFNHANCHSDEYLRLDLRRFEDCLKAYDSVPFDEVYHFAANMGGIGYITRDWAVISRDSGLINHNMLEAHRRADGGIFFFSSSACVYPAYRQEKPDIAPLAEDDAWPADPEPGYGMEKLNMEKLMACFHRDYRTQIRIARFHNIFGPLGHYDGGKEKAPAALCRKVALAKEGEPIMIWGDGRQTRSFLYIDDCLHGVYQLVQSNYTEPLNIGSSHMVTIAELAQMIITLSGKKLSIDFDLDGPQGVRGRNSDNTRVKDVLGWEPKVPLSEGLKKTYGWILRRMDAEIPSVGALL